MEFVNSFSGETGAGKSERTRSLAALSSNGEPDDPVTAIVQRDPSDATVTLITTVP